MNLTLGQDVLKNNGSGDVRLRDVRLQDAKGVELLEASIVPIVGGQLVGTWAQFPPPSQEMRRAGVDFDRRQPASGAVLRSASAGAPDYNLALHVKIADAEAVRAPSIAALTVSYERDGDDHELRTSTRYIFLDDCQ